jgi:hypothetical membrane protein
MVTTVRYLNIHGGAVRLAGLGGVMGPILFVVLVGLGGGLYEGYSHAGQKISELGGEGAQYPLLQNLNFILLGVSVIGFAWALAQVFGPPYWGAALIGMFGLSSSIANGLLPCDVGCQGETTIGLLHNITGFAGFVAAIVGMFALARRWRDDPTWRSHVGFTYGAAFVAIAGLIWFVVTQALDAQSLSGIAQRTFVAALLMWIAVTAARLTREVSAVDPLPTDAGTRPPVAPRSNRGG